MTAFRIDIDGAEVATVNLDGMQIFHLSVNASLHDASPVTIHANGGTYGGLADGHRIWIGERTLLEGQTLRISFIESDGPFDQGQTMADMFPNDEAPAAKYDFTVTEAMAAELRARPQLHASFAMAIATSAGEQCLVESGLRNDQFTFSVVWDGTRPAEARLSASTYCFEDVIARQRGCEHLASKLAVGDSATCALRA